MELGYVILSPGLAGDWGKCILVCEEFGNIIKGEIDINDLPKELLLELRSDNDIPLEETEIEEIAAEIYNTDFCDSDVFYYLSNLLYYKQSKYIIKFSTISELANYVRENNIELLGDLCLS